MSKITITESFGKNYTPKTLSIENIQKAQVLGYKVQCLRTMGYDSDKWVLIDASGEYRLCEARTTEQDAWNGLADFWDDWNIEQDYLNHDAMHYATNTDIPW